MRFIFCVLCIVTLASCGPVTKYPRPDELSIRQEASVQKQLAHGGLAKFTQDKAGRDAGSADERLQRVALRVLTAATPLCGIQIKSQLSIDILPDATDYPKVASATLPPYTSLHISPYPNAYDIKPGDRLLRIGNQQLETGHGGFRRALDLMIELETDNDFADVQILRDGKLTLTRRITSLPRCDYFVESVPRTSSPNAFADGESIRVTTSMVRMMPTDDELAFIFGHELGHNILAHASKSRIRVQLGYLLGTAEDIATGWWPRDEFGQLGTYLGSNIYSQSEENEADYMGTYIMASAGYEPDAALLAMRRLAFQNPVQIEDDWSTHPSSAERAAAIKTTIDEVKEKLRRNEVLMPKLNSALDREAVHTHYEATYPRQN